MFIPTKIIYLVTWPYVIYVILLWHDIAFICAESAVKHQSTN